MVFKKILGRFKKKRSEKKTTKKSSVKKKKVNKGKSVKSKYPNRFVKFYHLNKNRLNKERRSTYSTKKKKGLCVRCNSKAVKGVVFCKYHRQKQKRYNKIARSK